MDLVGVGLALVRFVIAKRCFRCESSLLSSHKRKKIMCVEVSPSRLFLGTHIPTPFPSHPSSSSLSQSPTTHPVSWWEAEAASSLLPYCLRLCSRDLLAQVFGILLCRLTGRGVGLAGWALADRFAGRLGWVALPAISP